MSLGFFSSKDFKINNPAALGDGCGKCRLYKTCNSPRMKPYGKGEGGIMIIGEAPGQMEDEHGIPFIGKPGKFLDSYLREYGIDPERDIVKLNAVNCRPPDNRDPTDQEIDQCRGRVWGAIEKYKPKVIIPLGAIAIKSLLSHRWNETDDKGLATGLGSIARWRGWQIPDRETKCWIAPCNHPAYVLRATSNGKGGEDGNRQQGNPAAERVFAADFKKAIRCLIKPMPTWRNERECVEIITDEETLRKRLVDISFGVEFARNGYKNNVIAFDYETTGLKPQNDGHRVVYIGIATGEESAIVFPTKGVSKAMRVFRAIMMNDTKKIAHNMQFEDMWTRERLGVQVQNWLMCTMQTAHVLDQRKGISGLKFQSYVQTGLVDYSSHIAPYLRASAQDEEKYGDNAFNRIYEAPPKEVMMYCGIDCIATYRLALIQAKKMGVEL